MQTAKTIVAVSFFSLGLLAASAQAVDEHHPDEKGATTKSAPAAPAPKSQNAPGGKDGDMPMSSMMQNMQRMHEQMVQIHQPSDIHGREKSDRRGEKHRGSKGTT